MILAQLSDIHLNGTPRRREKLLRGLGEARNLGAEHLILTGDLTSRGQDAQIHELGGVLAAAWPGRATIIPGNHDAGDAFDKALRPGGPLARFAKDSLGAVDLGPGVLVPIDTRYKRRALVFRAMGRAGATGFGAALEARKSFPDKTLVLVMHHGPQGHYGIDDLVDRRAFATMLAGLGNAHVVCGHDHRLLDKGSVHVAPSVAYHPDPLRTYELAGSRFEVRRRSSEPGESFTAQQVANELSGLGRPGGRPCNCRH
jgi:3',5'-cyclic AMP phosphodiesterase CpdA